MAWIMRSKRKDGTVMYWVRDYRGGQQIVIAGGFTRAEAEARRKQYEIRRDLEKEGYEDQYQGILDRLWGPQRQILKKTGDN